MNNWQLIKLKDVIKLEYGKPLDKTKREIKGLYPVFGANGEKARSNAYYFDKKSIIIGRKGSAGEINITTEKFWPLDVTYFVTFDERQYNLKFLFHLLNTLNLPRLAKGVKPGINRNDVYSLDVLIPPIPEQKRIVKILDEAFEAINKAKANAEKNLQNSRELFDSYLNKVFANPGEDWEEKKLGDVCNIIGGGTPAKSTSEYYTGNIPWATVRDMKFDVLATTEFCITKKAIKKSSSNLIPRNNVIIATRVGLGKVCILSNDTAINQDLKGILPKKKNGLDTSYLFYWFKSISKIIEANGVGATVKGVKIPFIESLKIPFPNLFAQKQIVNNLDGISSETKKLENIYQQKLSDLEELKKSILQKAFEGQLTIDNG